MINDITTDFDKPPQFISLDLSYPAKFKAEQLKKHPLIKPLRVERPAAECFLKCQEILKANKSWEFIAASVDKLSLEYTDTTRVFRYKDDVVLEFRETPEAHCDIHMRSKSRKGRSDLGKNAARIQATFELISKTLKK